MATTSYQRVASSVVEMLEELRAQVMKRHVQLTAQDASPSKHGKGRESRDLRHKHRVARTGK